MGHVRGAEGAVSIKAKIPVLAEVLLLKQTQMKSLMSLRRTLVTGWPMSAPC